MRYALIVAIAVGLAGCRATPAGTGGKTVTEKPGEPPAATQPEALPDREEEKAQVVLDTEKGEITLELDPAAAPLAVANFLELVESGFYDGMPFHRVEPGFVIQAGDPKFAAEASVSRSLPDERSPIKHLRGVVAMARLFGPEGMIPNSAGTQFYICLGEAPHLDRMGFTAFGKVVKGIEVIDRIAVGDKIRSARVLPRG